MAKKILVIMAKEPQAGKVKRRLCPPLTLEQAARLYECFLVDKIEVVISLRDMIKEVNCAVAFDPPTGQDFFGKLVPGWFELISQTGQDLGERFINGFDYFFGRGFNQVVIVDSDSPTLPSEYLGQSFKKLKNADVVLGPTEDGGYYLIGLTNPQPELFKGISWSTDSVLEQTTAQAKKHNLKVKLLPAWYDVDTPQSLNRLRLELANSLNGQEELAGKTKTFLDSLKNDLF